MLSSTVHESNESLQIDQQQQRREMIMNDCITETLSDIEPEQLKNFMGVSNDLAAVIEMALLEKGSGDDRASNNNEVAKISSFFCIFKVHKKHPIHRKTA